MLALYRSLKTKVEVKEMHFESLLHNTRQPRMDVCPQLGHCLHHLVPRLAAFSWREEHSNERTRDKGEGFLDRKLKEPVCGFIRWNRTVHLFFFDLSRSYSSFSWNIHYWFYFLELKSWWVFITPALRPKSILTELYLQTVDSRRHTSQSLTAVNSRILLSLCPKNQMPPPTFQHPSAPTLTQSPTQPIQRPGLTHHCHTWVCLGTSF